MWLACAWTRNDCEEARLAGAGGSAALPNQRKVLSLRGVVHAVGGPDVLHGCVLTALLRPEERVLQHPGRDRRLTPAVAANVPATSPAVGARAAAPLARPPRYPKAPPTPSAATATSPSSAATLNGLCCAALGAALVMGAALGLGGGLAFLLGRKGISWALSAS